MDVRHSKLDTDIKSRLEIELTTYIEMNEATIESTQQFLSGIAQTVDMTILHTNGTTRDLSIIKYKAKNQPVADGIIFKSACSLHPVYSASSSSTFYWSIYYSWTPFVIESKGCGRLTVASCFCLPLPEYGSLPVSTFCHISIHETFMIS